MPMIIPPTLTEEDGALTKACEDALVVRNSRQQQDSSCLERYTRRRF